MNAHMSLLYKQELPVWETLGQHSSKTGETNIKTREQQHFKSLPGRVNTGWLTRKSQLILLCREGSSGTGKETWLASTLGLQNTTRKFLSRYFWKVVLDG